MPAIERVYCPSNLVSTVREMVEFLLWLLKGKSDNRKYLVFEGVSGPRAQRRSMNPLSQGIMGTLSVMRISLRVVD